MAGKEGMYEQIAARAAKGDYTLVEPMDYMIIGHLNDEGTMFAGAYPLAHTTTQVSRDVFNKQIPATLIGPRMNSLTIQGLVIQVKVPGNLGKNAYQRTQKGKHVYEEWSRKNGTSAQDSSAVEG